MHKQLGMDPASLTSFPMATMLWAADLTMCNPPLWRLPFTLTLHNKRYSLFSSLGQLEPSIRIMLTFRLFGMMHQSNLAL